MKYKPLKYKVFNTSPGVSETVEVQGYAVDSPYRICVRAVGSMWQCDHYDTGFRIGGMDYTRDDCAREAIERIERQRPGFYDECQKAALRWLKVKGVI